MRNDLTPLQVCERLIGGYPVLAAIVGYSEKAPYVWAKGGDTRDAGDIPSVRLMRAFLAHSDARALGLTADHLIRGADAAQIDAILAARQGLEAAE